jgi:hypothetical protein
MDNSANWRTPSSLSTARTIVREEHAMVFLQQPDEQAGAFSDQRADVEKFECEHAVLALMR